MAGREGNVRIEPSSTLYQEFVRLYQIAQEQHPGGEDRWNRELYAITDAKWGGLAPDGTMRLNEELVLKHLTGGELSDDPERQGQALATVLHESKHARAGRDAPNEPNAVRRRESFGLNEGLTELATTEDFADFTQRAGYDGVPQPQPGYAGAVHAGNELLTRATSSEQERSELLFSTIDQPVAMGWDNIADHVVRNELADDVPPDVAHQQAARAHLVNQMAIGEWDGVHRPGGHGRPQQASAARRPPPAPASSRAAAGAQQAAPGRSGGRVEAMRFLAASHPQPEQSTIAPISDRALGAPAPRPAPEWPNLASPRVRHRRNAAGAGSPAD